jgi:predicted signal transduction protein with EAL and GGDEF domain
MFSIVNFFFRNDSVAGVIELFFASLIIYSFINLRIKKDVKKSALQVTYLLFFFLITLFFMFRFDNGIIFWALLFPFSIINLLGNRIGIRFIIVFNLIVYIGAYYYWSIAGVELIEYIRFVTVSLIMSMMVYLHERNFSRSMAVQKELNESLTKSMEETKTLAITDSLTKLYNKRHFDTVLNEEFNCAKRANEPFILAIIDVDNFKLYNDTYGHDEGNLVLE